MTRTEQLKAAVTEAYKNGMENVPEIAGLSDEDLAGDMIAYDDDIAQMWGSAEPEGWTELANEIAAILPEVRRAYAERAGA